MQQETNPHNLTVSRRHFLKVAGLTTLGSEFTDVLAGKAQGISIVLDPADSMANGASVQWATNELERSLSVRGIGVQRCQQLAQATAGNLCVLVADSKSSGARSLLKASGTAIPAVPEALGLIPGRSTGKPVLLACGYDERGLMYAVLELADRIQYEARPVVSLTSQKALVEQPANAIQSLTRLFVSEVEDKLWTHARAFSFSGSAGAELMEPLSFKGRRGTGIAGSRCGYADTSLEPRWDWGKYRYSLRLFGRLLYNPEADPAIWNRYLKKQFGAGAEAVGQALANATRILPIVLTTHGTSAGNNTYWPEMYTNQPIVDPAINGSISHLYDTPSPKVFGNVSPLDPQLFLSINGYAQELLNGKRSGKYTPIETAQWLDDYAAKADKHLAKAEAKAEGKQTLEFRRMATDVAMQIGLGRFFASKFRAGVLYAVFEQTGDRMALEQALNAYQKARSFWADLANRAKDTCKPDITVGERAFLRGHWLDRLPAMDQDIAAMTRKLNGAESSPVAAGSRTALAIREALERPRRIPAACRHARPPAFRADQSVDLELTVEKAPQSIRLYYRRLTQAERYETVEMQAEGKRYRATIPAAYTNSPYALQYYFDLKDEQETACLYPGFNFDLTNQPYFLLRQV